MSNRCRTKNSVRPTFAAFESCGDVNNLKLPAAFFTFRLMSAGLKRRRGALVINLRILLVLDMILLDIGH